jgi:threonine dehydratase
MVAFEDVVAAREAIAGKVHFTPVFTSATLSNLVGSTVVIKAECLQKTGSFKPRGVVNRLRFLTDDEKARGLITISAGNHGQALAWGARQAAAACTVVMPEAAPLSKVRAAEGYGATVILHGTPGQAVEHMETLRRQRNLTLIHPFDDEKVIAGQGTIGLEIAEQAPGVTTVVVPVGGGGLISGIALALKQLRPGVKVYGVEPDGAAALFKSRATGRAVQLDNIQTIADGLAAPYAGQITFGLAEQYVDELVTVSDEQLAEGVRFTLGRCKLVVEAAGAAGVAALLSGKIPVEPGDVIVVVASGGNVDLDRLKAIL